jgi:hypothetical protein
METKNSSSVVEDGANQRSSSTRFPLLRERLKQLAPDVEALLTTEDEERQALALLAGSLLPLGGGQ